MKRPAEITDKRGNKVWENTVETGKKYSSYNRCNRISGRIPGKAPYKGIPGSGNGKEPGTGEET